MISLLVGIPLWWRVWFVAGILSAAAIEYRDRKDPTWQSARFFCWPLFILLGGVAFALTVLAYIAGEER